MYFVNANVSHGLPYVESLTVTLSNNEIDMICNALRNYAGDNSYYYEGYTSLADNFTRYVAEGAYSEALDKIMNTGFFDDNLRDGKVIPVVKMLRGATDCGLAAAKHATDRRKEALNI